jgi:hypothetical protein
MHRARLPDAADRAAARDRIRGHCEVASPRRLGRRRRRLYILARGGGLYSVDAKFGREF